MAYNPFNIFRRNQKVIFAVITVFIMFTFVLSSGLGGGADFFDWLPRWLGSRSKRGPVICTIDGTKVTEAELTGPQGLRYQRLMANRFMDLASAQTAASLDQYASENLGRLSPAAKQVMDQVTLLEGQWLSLLRQAEQFPQLRGQLPLFRQQTTEQMRSLLSQIIDSPNMKSEDKDIARAKFIALSLEQSRVLPEHYFVSAPNQTLRDLINFRLWQKKADQLGIRYTTDDVKQLIEREFYGSFRSDVKVRELLQKQMPGFTMDKCLAAIGEEFRVRTAQAAVLGPDAFGGRLDKTYGGFPLFTPPYEMFEYFREQTSPTSYAAIPVPVANFLDRVPDPDENNPAVRAELTKLYDDYRNDEPRVDRETPGFRSPRRVRVEWLTATGEEPYYTRLAEDRVKLGEPTAKVGSLLTVPIPGMGLTWIGPAVAPTHLKDLVLTAAYEKELSKHDSSLRSRYARDWLDFSDFAPPLDTNVVRPGNLAAAFGGLGGQLAGFGNPYAAGLTVVGGVMGYEVRERARIGAPSVLLALGTIPAVKYRVLGVPVGKGVPGLLPGPGLFANLMGGLATYQALLPKPLPLDFFRPQLLKDHLASSARELAREDLEKFVAEVNKLSENGRAKDLGPVQKYIPEFVTQRGLVLHGNPTPLAEWELESAPELAPLVAAQKRSLSSPSPANPHRGQYIPFAQKFFWDLSRGSRTPATTRYEAEFYPPEMRFAFEAAGKQRYVVWRSVVEPSKPLSFPESKAAVKAAWKRIKARELAQARAEQLRRAIEASDKTSEVLLLPVIYEEVDRLRNEFTDPAARDRVEPFPIRGVAPLTTVENPTQEKGLDRLFPVTGTGRLRPFQLPPSENLKYPTNEFATALLENRTKQPKTTLVLSDAPKDTFYVVTLLNRSLKDLNDFQAIYSPPPPPPEPKAGANPSERSFTDILRQQYEEAMATRQMILGGFLDESRRKTIESVIALLKKQFNYEETEEQKKRLDESERRGGGEP